MLAFQILASMKYQLVIMDVTSAFGQSDPETRPQGELYASLPSSGNSRTPRVDTDQGLDRGLWPGECTIELEEDRDPLHPDPWIPRVSV